MKRCLPLLVLLAVPVGSHAAVHGGGTSVALVTAETENRLLAVQLPSGRILRSLPMPADPENVEANGRDAVVVSTRGAAVTIVDVRRLRVRRTIYGFSSPHIAALSPDGRFAYVTDDARGQLVVIGLAHDRVRGRVFVGLGAHHMAFRPGHKQLWIALGERARTIVVASTSNPVRPHPVRRFHPDGLAHDLGFPAGGRRLWLTYDDRSRISVIDARTLKERFSLAAGSAPQHVAFRRYVYVTSGNDGKLRVFSVGGRLLGVATTPTGSYNLSLARGRVLTSSLTNGTLTELGVSGRLLLRERVAPAARDVAVVP